MKVHHISCGTMCPAGGRLLNDAGGLLHARMVCHCLLIEAPDRLVLVDTGFGTHQLRNLGPERRLLAVDVDATRPAIDHVRDLGYDPADVREIVLTHLDLDHAGGLADFPHARVHVMAQEHEAATSGALAGALRYRPSQWAHDPTWALHRAQGEHWRGFQAVRELPGLPPEILLVPLRGHTLGHAGVAVELPEGPLLHAGDAYFYHRELDADRRRCPPVLRAFQRLLEADRDARRANLWRLRELAREGDVRVFCAHDPAELGRLQAAETLVEAAS